MSQRRILNGWKQIAEYLQVHEQTAIKWAAEEGLPCAKIGGQVLASVNSIEVWIISNEHKGVESRNPVFKQTTA